MADQQPAGCFRSKRYVICVNVGGVRSKVMQVMFSRRDGSLLVSFPYYAHTEGLVSVAGLMPGASELDLAAEGKVTSHRVKYAHHPDGRAHFSQDGKVLTQVKKQSVPLDAINGHCFTVQLQGLEPFVALDAAEYDAPSRKQRTVLTFDFADEDPEAVKIAGRLYNEQELTRRVPTGTLRAVMATEDSSRTVRPAFLLCAPTGQAGDDRILMLTCDGTPSLNPNENTALMFIGGFDAPRTVFDHSRATYVLALQYPPGGDAEVLRRSIGTIDLPAPSFPVQSLPESRLSRSNPTRRDPPGDRRKPL